MFLDPEPRRQNMSTRSTRSTSSTSTISSRASQRSLRPTLKPSGVQKRRPLQERTRSEINQQTPQRSPDKPTVRLVQHSPSPNRSTPWSQWSQRSEDSTRVYEAQEVPLYQGLAREQAARAMARRLSFSQDASRDGSDSEVESDAELPSAPASTIPLRSRVSASNHLAPRLPKLQFPPSVTLIPNRYSRDAAATIRADSRRDTASASSESNIFTIPETDSLFASGSIKSDWFSETSTLRNTVTPTEHEILAKLAQDEPVRRVSIPLAALPETSPERITIRTVPLSDDRSSPDQHELAYRDVNPEMFPSPARHTRDDASSMPHVARSRFQAPVSKLSKPMELDISSANAHVEPRPRPSMDSLAASACPAPSSPIIVIYESDSSRPQSTNHALRYTPSVESIQSRLQYPSIIRAIPGTALTARSSYASLRESPSIETLQPLRVSKKRALHRRQARSIDESSIRSSSLHNRDVDPAWPQNHPSGNLSTIASESDRNSQDPTARFSQWSMDSGVLAGDGTSAILDLGDWRRPRRWSDSAASMVSPTIPAGAHADDSEVGDMTLGIYREESAIPQPLFRPEQTRRSNSKIYRGPMPPLPPMPAGHDGDEHDDTLTEMDPQALRLKKSAKSLRRQRSNNSGSDRARPYSQASIVDSDRLSVTSSIFPTWAKQYYGGRVVLMSPSKASLARPITPRRGKHERTQSEWTARSILSARSIRSRLGTAHSSAASSLSSSHFLPSIFRTRFRADDVPSPKRPRSPLRKQILTVTNSSPVASVAELPAEPVITTIAAPEIYEEQDPENPQVDALEEACARVDREKRRRNKKKRITVGVWDDAMLPRRMSHSTLPVIDDAAHLHSPDPNRLSVLYSSPHLTPNKRTSEARLSLWPPPSFVESLDQLLHSRAHRQLALFAAGFICPLLWFLGAVLPVPEASPSVADIERDAAANHRNDIDTIMKKHAANDPEKRSREERLHVKGLWWRRLNRIMSVIGILIIAAVIAIVVIATK